MGKRSVVVVAEEILLKTGHPLHYKEITKMLLDQCNLLGKTPHETVRSRLATSPKFKRVAEGVFGLAIWTQYPAIRFAKNIAYDILKNRGRPITLRSLGEEIKKEREFVSDPAQVVRGSLRTDHRFYLDTKSSLVGLEEWRRK